MTARLMDKAPESLSGSPPRVCLLGGPYLWLDGHREPVPEGCQRLLVYLCLRDCPVLRRHAAGELWPSVPEARAAGSLRSALWRLRSCVTGLVDSDSRRIWLCPGVENDVTPLRHWAARLNTGQHLPEDLRILWWHADVVDLLPGWYEDWVCPERERLRQCVLHALERLATVLVQEGRHADGVEIALLAAGIDPLRESAQRRLIAAHLAEGNVGEADRVGRAYTELLYRELGLMPSPALLGMLPGRRPGACR